MPQSGNANLVGGRWTASAGGGRFELREPLEPWGEIGSWPTSGPADAEVAVADCADAAAAWSTIPADEIRARLLSASRALERDEDVVGQIARRLGLRPGEARRHGRGLEHALLGALDRPVAGGEGSVAVCAPHWSELIVGPLTTVAGELARGRAVVLVSDARLPMVADRVAAAFLEAGVTAGVVAVLHGLTRDGLARAVCEPRVEAVVASGARELLAALRTWCDERRMPRQVLNRLRSTAIEVGAQEDLDAAARRVMAGAFGRTMTLFGQCRGQIGRVFCDERRFSRFTECLLVALADSESVRDPLPLIDSDAAFAVRRRWALGLDEGATLILGGESAEDSSGRRLLPTVFTNVEERMSMARQVDPMPVLCLLRTPWKP